MFEIGGKIFKLRFFVGIGKFFDYLFIEKMYYEVGVEVFVVVVR